MTVSETSLSLSGLLHNLCRVKIAPRQPKRKRSALVAALFDQPAKILRIERMSAFLHPNDFTSARKCTVNNSKVPLCIHCKSNKTNPGWGIIYAVGRHSTWGFYILFSSPSTSRVDPPYVRSSFSTETSLEKLAVKGSSPAAGRLAPTGRRTDRRSYINRYTFGWNGQRRRWKLIHIWRRSRTIFLSFSAASRKLELGQRTNERQFECGDIKLRSRCLSSTWNGFCAFVKRITRAAFFPPH